MTHHSGVENPVAAEETEDSRSAKIKKIALFPFSPGQRSIKLAAIVAAEVIDEERVGNPQRSARRWGIGSAAGSIACIVAAYGAVKGFRSAVANGSPGEGLEGFGFLPITTFAVGATAEMASIYWKRREAAQWHELIPEEQSANENYQDNPAS